MWKVLLPVLAALFAVGYKSEAGVPGGFSDIDISDRGAQNALNFAVLQHNKGRNDMFLSGVAEVTRVQSQVVAGIKYVITVRMAKTNCRKGSVGEQCEVHQDPALAQPYECKFTVWSRPWLNEMKVLEEKC